MECSYFKKANFFKRLLGSQGYCTFHQADIKQSSKITYHPYICCKGTNGEVFNDCPIQFRMSKR